MGNKGFGEKGEMVGKGSFLGLGWGKGGKGQTEAVVKF